jgi:hypothetical protein
MQSSVIEHDLHQRGVREPLVELLALGDPHFEVGCPAKATTVPSTRRWVNSSTGIAVASRSALTPFLR